MNLSAVRLSVSNHRHAPRRPGKIPTMLFLAPPPVPAASAPAVSALPTPPALRRELRGAWVATVGNIDWPSKPGLSAAAQQAELLAILDRAQALHLNAVLLQVRPACDALYGSPLEPWSAVLSGTEGTAPAPLYDPLAFAVTEAHKRGIELHAWFNPYRAKHGGATSGTAPNHVLQTHPERVRVYGTQFWLDPGLPEVREYSLAVVLDVVNRYDVDGVHIDDYFYPYPIAGADGKPLPFPDAPTYAAYQAKGGALSLGDFRRDAVDTFVRELYGRVHAAKPWVKVGISPFGIGKPGVPAQIKGFDARAELYGDAVKWINEGWADYFSPQLYWRIEQTPQSFPVLLGYWIAENRKSRILAPGLFTSKYDANEIAYQVKTARGFAGTGGAVQFSMSALLPATPGAVGATLAGDVYAEPALLPETAWLAPAGSAAPPAPANLRVSPAESSFVPAVLRWDGGEGRSEYVIQSHAAGVWKATVVPAGFPLALALPPGTDSVSVFAVDRYGRAGKPAALAVLPGN